MSNSRYFSYQLGPHCLYIVEYVYERPLLSVCFVLETVIAWYITFSEHSIIHWNSSAVAGFRNLTNVVTSSLQKLFLCFVKSLDIFIHVIVIIIVAVIQQAAWRCSLTLTGSPSRSNSLLSIFLSPSSLLGISRDHSSRRQRLLGICLAAPAILVLIVTLGITARGMR